MSYGPVEYQLFNIHGDWTACLQRRKQTSKMKRIVLSTAESDAFTSTRVQSFFHLHLLSENRIGEVIMLHSIGGSVGGHDAARW